mmetsp:Transcript_28100/g.43264  ORF Transcript_28100/g.43264 Transcript_28100/m.43264 type:complete len:178 (-) Transcript_28100:498-1031(-)
MKVMPYGDRGVLMSDLSLIERGKWIERLEENLPATCEEFVIGHDSLLLIGDVETLMAGLCDGSMDCLTKVASLERTGSPRSHEIVVSYDGEDLEFVAKTVGVSVEDIIEMHTSPIYTVRMMGFSPGFPYLDGLDACLHLERRASPRLRIKPGRVAIGGPHAGIYSVSSPGVGTSRQW